MRIELQEAYVIHSRPYRDTSLLVDFLTPDYGRISAIVKGVRASTKTAKQRRSLIQPFVPLLVSWGGRSALKTLFHCEAQKPAVLLHKHGITSDRLQGERLFCAMYVNELLMRLLKAEDVSHSLYHLYQQVLSYLAGNDPVDLILRQFEFSLLDELGYGLNFDVDTESGEPIKADCYYRFSADQGFSLFSSAPSGENVFIGTDIIALAQGDSSPQSRAIAKRICRVALGFHLGAKPLKSRELFK